MARTKKSKRLKSHNKVKESKSTAGESSRARVALEKRNQKRKNQRTLSAKELIAAPKIPVKTKEVVAATNGTPKKKMADRLLETLEKRKKSPNALPPKGTTIFVRPKGRRGRRPKNTTEYVPMHQEEDSYVLESESEGLEYDTGIRASDQRDDGTMSFERAEDFDEELNFDW